MKLNILTASLAATLCLALSAGTAFAETCPGTNLVEQLAAQNRPAHAALRAEADALVNGTGTFWRVASGTGPPSFLFGTMHVADARVVALPEPVAEAIDGARTLAVEVLDAEDPATLAGILASEPALLVPPDGARVSDGLDAADREALAAAYAGRGVDFATLDPFQPWIAAAALSISGCEFALQAAGNRPLDALLVERAEAAGIEATALESLAGQLAAISSLGRDTFIESLVAYARLDAEGTLDDLHATLVALYLNEDIGAILPATVAFTGAVQDKADMDEFERAMVEARNRSMTVAVLPLIEAGGAFIAVGAMHLPGETGLVAALRDAGYDVTRVPLNR